MEGELVGGAACLIFSNQGVDVQVKLGLKQHAKENRRKKLFILQVSVFYIVKDDISQIFACKQSNNNL